MITPRLLPSASASMTNLLRRVSKHSKSARATMRTVRRGFAITISLRTVDGCNVNRRICCGVCRCQWLTMSSWDGVDDPRDNRSGAVRMVGGLPVSLGAHSSGIVKQNRRERQINFCQVFFLVGSFDPLPLPSGILGPRSGVGRPQRAGTRSISPRNFTRFKTT